LDGEVDSVPPGEGCEVLDGEVSDEEWGKMTIKMLLLPAFCKMGDLDKVNPQIGGEKFQRVQYDPSII